MSEKQPKYVVLEGATREDIDIKINAYAEDGYKIHSYSYSEYSINKGIYGHKYTALMTLDLGYSDVVKVADAPEQEANRLLALKEGWEIASTSVSSKFYRMVKRDKPSNS